MLWAGRLDKIMATRKRHSPEQIVRKLTAADRLLAEGKDTAAVCRELGVSEASSSCSSSDTGTSVRAANGYRQQP
jgi:hypothetical protein